MTGRESVSAIEFANVRKAYRRRWGRGSLRDAIPQMLGRVIGRDGQGKGNLLWALDGVSFEVGVGETLGLIGPNGAGKTTILKLLSRITQPTSGHIAVNGRVAALIQLGAGFHPDLTGRENIYLNGAILGLKRHEIDEQFESIVEFSELEEFIDMPVKRYSSGMYARLGFSVAAHVDPEVLLVDEVLAVGDRAFQKKCHRKMKNMASGATTIVVVSHNMLMINDICSRTIWLEKGCVQEDGETGKVIQKYIESSDSGHSTISVASGERSKWGRRWGSGEAIIKGVRYLNRAGEEISEANPGESVCVEICYEAEELIQNPVFGIGIYDRNGLHIFGENTGIGEKRVPFIEGKGRMQFWIDHLPFIPASYFLTVAIHRGSGSVVYDWHDKAYLLNVVGPSDPSRVGMLSLSTSWRHLSAQ